MNEATWPNLITAIHASEHPTVLAITGGGSGAISQLLEVPGASRTVLEAIVPYASTAQADWLGSAADQACSESTARAMAMASWMRAQDLAPDSAAHQLVGVGATASLVSDRPKRGEHRIHVAIQTSTVTATYSLVLAKNERDRIAEEAIATQMILLGLAAACELEVNEAHTAFENQLQSTEQIVSARQQADSRWTNLLLGDRSQVGYPDSFHPQAVFPGAFNPPHTGHQRIARVAATKLGCPVAFELSITNVDKPPLDFVETDARLKGLQAFDAQTPVLLTDAPTFRKKSELFPGCTFIVGADTIERVGDPKYYSGAEGSFDAAIQQIADAGCRFLVFGREINGVFKTLSDLTLPPALKKLCDEVTTKEFREDVSSTEVRNGNTTP